MMPVKLLAVLSICATVATPAWAQPKRPRVELTTAIDPTPQKEGGKDGRSVRLLLKVKLPADVHVQSDKPRDPSLIPTVLTVKAPEGLKVDRIVYPRAIDLVQPARVQPLAVFGSEFTIDIYLSLAPEAPTGEFIVPAELRYQACDAAVCYPPAKAEVQWTLRLDKS